MFKVNGTDITLTRGDTLVAEIGIRRNDEPYTPVAEDSIRFALKHSTMNADHSEFTDEQPLIRKEIPYDTLILKLDPADTKPYGFGRYRYDIEITFEDGTVDTFIKGFFTLTEEVD